MTRYGWKLLLARDDSPRLFDAQMMSRKIFRGFSLERNFENLIKIFQENFLTTDFIGGKHAIKMLLYENILALALYTVVV